MSWFRVPARTLFLANLAGAVLAGLGVQTLATRLAARGPGDGLPLAAALLLLFIVLSLYAIGFARDPQSLSQTAEAARRVLEDDCFRFTLGGLAVLLALGCAPCSRSHATVGRLP